MLAALPTHAQAAGEIQLNEAMSTAHANDFARATAIRKFEFPADHGPHPEFKTEWWYFTGNLNDADRRLFGYELTIFRIGLTSHPIASSSLWRSRDLYMAHFAMTDVQSNRFHHFERFNRGALSMAGAIPMTLEVWLDDWSVRPVGDAVFPLRLNAHEDDIRLELELNAAKPPVLNGVRGLSQKSAEEGNASYYYSMTRLPTHGTIQIGSQRFAVTGASWLDREWSTSALADDQAGWDWFALQLSDNTELMFYRLRRRDGRMDTLSAGTYVAASGTTEPLAHDDVAIEELGTWRSPQDGARYPSGWRIVARKQGLDLTVTPLVENQELAVSVRYWEGAVTIQGVANGRPLSGKGYVELTGYAR
jgi:predicted secreted hydrolase